MDLLQLELFLAVFILIETVLDSLTNRWKARYASTAPRIREMGYESRVSQRLKQIGGPADKRRRA